MTSQPALDMKYKSIDPNVNAQLYT